MMNDICEHLREVMSRVASISASLLLLQCPHRCPWCDGRTSRPTALRPVGLPKTPTRQVIVRTGAGVPRQRKVAGTAVRHARPNPRSARPAKGVSRTAPRNPQRGTPRPVKRGATRNAPIAGQKRRPSRPAAGRSRCGKARDRAPCRGQGTAAPHPVVSTLSLKRHPKTGCLSRRRVPASRTVTHSQVGGSSSHRPAARGAKRSVRSEERLHSSKVSDELSTPRGAESLPDDDSDEIYVLRDVPARAAAKSERRAARLTDELMIHTCAVFERDLARLRGSGSARSEFLPEKPAAQTSNRAAAPPVDARVQCDRAKAPRKGDCPSRSADAAYRRNFVFSRDRPGGSPAACGVSPNSVSCRKMEGSFAAESVKGAEKAKCVTRMPREVAVSPRCAVQIYYLCSINPTTSFAATRF